MWAGGLREPWAQGRERLSPPPPLVTALALCPHTPRKEALSRSPVPWGWFASKLIEHQSSQSKVHFSGFKIQGRGSLIVGALRQLLERSRGEGKRQASTLCREQPARDAEQFISP